MDLSLFLSMSVQFLYDCYVQRGHTHKYLSRNSLYMYSWGGNKICSVCSLRSINFYEMLYKGWSLKYCLMIASDQLPIPPLVMVLTDPFHHWSWCWLTHSTSGLGTDPPIPPAVIVLTHPFHQQSWCWPTHSTSGQCWPIHYTSGHGVDPPIIPVVTVLTHSLYQWSWCWPTHYTSGHIVDPPIPPVVTLLTHFQGHGRVQKEDSWKVYCFKVWLCVNVFAVFVGWLCSIDSHGNCVDRRPVICPSTSAGTGECLQPPVVTTCTWTVSTPTLRLSRWESSTVLHWHVEGLNWQWCCINTLKGGTVNNSTLTPLRLELSMILHWHANGMTCHWSYIETLSVYCDCCWRLSTVYAGVHGQKPVL